MAIATSVATVEEGRGGRRGDRVPAPAPANDQQDGAGLVERDIAQLLAAEYWALIAYSRRLTANDADAADLVHSVCARVLSQRTPIASVQNLSGWLRTVLFHTFVDLRRRARREIPMDAALLERPNVAAEPEGGDPRITVEDVRALLALIPPHYRVPYEMFTFDEMPYARIAAALGLTCVTVGTRINRARERLRRLIRARFGG